jgi:hypothetical protein
MAVQNGTLAFCLPLVPLLSPFFEFSTEAERMASLNELNYSEREDAHKVQQQEEVHEPKANFRSKQIRQTPQQHQSSTRQPTRPPPSHQQVELWPIASCRKLKAIATGGAEVVITLPIDCRKKQFIRFVSLTCCHLKIGSVRNTTQHLVPPYHDRSNRCSSSW